MGMVSREAIIPIDMAIVATIDTKTTDPTILKNMIDLR
jgi:hypothetical protein